MSQRPRRPAASQQPPVENLDHLTCRVVKYLLEKANRKYPVKASDIKKYVLGKHADHFRLIIKNTEDKLRKIFGYELVHVTGAQYFISNMLDNKYLQFIKPESENKEQTLLFIVLAFIFMCADDNENAIISEDELWEFLMNLSIINEQENHHPHFGDVKSLISQKFVKQLYLSKSKHKETDAILYQWGPRADHELDRKSVLKFVAKIYNCPIENFPKQYKAVKAYERSALQE